MENKIKYGQFFTKNSEYIVGDLIDSFISKKIINKNSKIIDPFVGNGDLLDIIEVGEKIGYDIDIQKNGFIKKNTFLDVPNYSDKIIITNPPWLAKNKNKDKENINIYEKYNTNDLYKCALLSFIETANNGIIILPLNFWCESRGSIRKDFLNIFRIDKVKVFEEKIFEDTTYTACAFAFSRCENISEQKIIFEFWKDSKFKDNKFVCGSKKPYKEIELKLLKKDDYIVGSSYYKFIKNNKSKNIKRYIKGDSPKNTLVLYAQDTGSENGKIRLESKDTPHIDMTPNNTDRVFAGIKILNGKKEFQLNKEQELIVCENFNKKINYYRKKYNSLNLTNFRNSNTEIARKRISFYEAYSIISWALKESNIKINQNS